MVQAFVACPQCKKKFQISIHKKTGICPQCSASLIFEVVSPPVKKTDQGCHEEYIRREDLQKGVDETISGKSKEPHHPHIQDIAIISTFDPPRQLATIEKSVDRLLQS